MSVRVGSPGAGIRTVEGHGAAGPIANPSTLYELLLAQAQRDPESFAILAPGRAPLSFGALLDQIDTIRTTLNGWGLGRGDRIALLGALGPEMAAALLGLACCTVCVPLNSAAPESELEQGLKDTGAKALLVPTTARAEVKSLARRLGLLLLEYSVEESAPAGTIRISGGRTAVVAQGGPAAAGDIAFVLRTSGTTARAKLVPISHHNIVARTAKSRRLFELGPGDRCLNLMPLCYHHGLNSGLMLPLAAGATVICPSAFNAETFLTCMVDFSPTWYTASFTYHQTILEWLEQRPNALAGHRLRFLRSGAGPLPARVRTGLEAILGVPMLEYYGMTETGAVTANSPVARKPGTVGASPDNDIAIVDENGERLPSGIEGEVVVRGDIVFNGYENDPATNQRVFRGGWYRTGDRGTMDGDGFVKLLGRLDEVINRGGEKISPQEVDDALLAHEAVAEAVSFPVPHRTLHQEIAAAVVLYSGAQVTSDDLRRFVAERLTSYKVPRVILCTTELPKGPTGKLKRSALAAHFDISPQQESNAATPRVEAEPTTETQRALLALWRDVLKRQDIGCDDDFFLSGGDSLSAVDLLHRIEKTLSYALPLNILAEAPSVRKLERRLETATPAPINNTIRIHVRGSQRPLFVVGGTGGHCLYLYSILHALGPDQPCYALQPPGMDWSSVGCSTIPEMAAYYIDVMKQIQSHGPFRMIGHSFGGRVTYEMALQLQRMGEAVEFLGMLDTYPTNYINESSESASQRPSREGLPKPRNSIEAINFNVIESHWSASRNHEMDSRLEHMHLRSALTYFYCTGEPIVARHDRRRLWQHFAPAGYRLLPLPGLHGWTGQGPQYTALPDLLRACLNGAPVASCDPNAIFDRTYRMENNGQQRLIVSGNGDEYIVAETALQGYIDTVTSDRTTVRFAGWAVDHCGRRPASTIAVFLGDRYLGYGACGTSRPDIAQQLDAPAAYYAGFDFNFRGIVTAGNVERPRLFVLSSDGTAAELRLSAVQEAIDLHARLADIQSKLTDSKNKLADSRNDLAGNETTLAEIRNKLADGEISRADLMARCADLAAQLDAMENSTSWRITRPMRQLRRLIARISGR